MTSMEGPKLQFNIDLDETEALNQKRTLAFINHWVYHTVLFLNQFSTICQQKLSTLETKIRRANDLLSTLESKLSSIPGLEDEAILKEISANPTEEKDITSSDTINTTQILEKEPITEQKGTESMGTEIKKSSLIPISSHPDYAPFFKMVNFGVPREAVKLKMTASGIDSSLLDNPTMEIEYEGKENGSDNSSNSQA